MQLVKPRESAPQQNVARKVVWIYDCVISRRFIGRPELRVRILLRRKNSKDMLNGFGIQETPHEVDFLNKAIEEITQLEQRIALLIELEDRAIFGFSIREV